jgi:hypothetical protein
MGWLFMSRGGMAPFATPKAYLDNQCTYPPDPEKGRRRACGCSSRPFARAPITPPARATTPRPARDLRDHLPGQMEPRRAQRRRVRLQGHERNDGALQLRLPGLDPRSAGAARQRICRAVARACRQRLALTSRRKPRPGDMLVLAEPLTFTDGQSERSFRVVQSGRRPSCAGSATGSGSRSAS